MKSILAFWTMVALRTTLVLSLFISIPQNLYSQSRAGYQYISPKPNYRYASTTTKIIIRPGDIISRTSVRQDILTVSGNKKGVYTGTVVLAGDNKTLVFTPAENFIEGETVSVKVRQGLLKENGEKIADTSFTFQTCISYEYVDSHYLKNELSLPSSQKNTYISGEIDSLPVNFPVLAINKSSNPSPGYLFLSFYGYLIIADDTGLPVFYQGVGNTIYDFKLQPNGELTYFIYPNSCYGLDRNLKIARSYTTANGFSIDVHELVVLPDGGYYIFGKRAVVMDLSGVVPGGLPNAQVIDGALQQFDSSGNLVFQWDALENYEISDVDDYVNLTNSVIDFSHFNSIEIDNDGNLLLSARNLNEVTKINAVTGKIIWRFGGRNNDFVFLNGAAGFYRQHHVRRFSNGNISLFDNGNYLPVPVSSIVEYRLDEINRTAFQERRYIHPQKIFSATEGSVQELPNGNRLIGWGNSYRPAITEITPGSTISFELSTLIAADEYRAFRFLWKTQLFTTNTDSVNFEKVKLGNTYSKPIVLYNPQDTILIIDKVYCNDTSFSVGAALPISINPRDSVTVPVIFRPKNISKHNATINFRIHGFYQGYEQMIARQVRVTGVISDSIQTNIESTIAPTFSLKQNYPNPFNPSTKIDYSLQNRGNVKLQIFSSTGEFIATLVDKTMDAGEYSVNFSGKDISSGLYFYRISVNNTITAKKMILIK